METTSSIKKFPSNFDMWLEMKRIIYPLESQVTSIKVSQMYNYLIEKA